MAKKESVTSAIRQIREKDIDYKLHIYDYKEKGGTKQTADELGVDEHCVVKTLVFADDEKNLFLVLMHGDKEVSLKELARQIGTKKVTPADARQAMNATGYKFGGTSPFGIKQNLPVYVQVTIFGLERIFINGGKQGYIIEIKPEALNVLNFLKIDAAL
ncbi:MAG: YbaK/EbsC family protein [Bacteroidota bacterium]